MCDAFGLLSRLPKRSPTIDNAAFRLHYRATASVLVVCALVVACHQNFGSPINCVVDGVTGDELIDNYCWANSFGVGDARVKYTSATSPQHVIESAVSTSSKLYQWTFLVLLLQSLLFYAPAYLWRKWEGGRVSSLLKDLKKASAHDDQTATRNALSRYFSSENLNAYAFRYFFCEAANLANVVVQLVLIDLVLRAPVRDELFPRDVDCTYKKYAAIGVEASYGAKCHVHFNVVNGNVLLFLWYWFLVVAVVSGTAVVYRLVSLFVPQVRVHLLRVKSGVRDRRRVERVCGNCSVGDWFLLSRLGANLDAVAFRGIVESLGGDARDGDGGDGGDVEMAKPALLPEEKVEMEMQDDPKHLQSE